MILILCEATDAVARGFLPVLSMAADPVPVEILTTAELVYSPALTHWIGDGPPRASVSTRRLGTIGPESLTGVVNRIHSLPEGHLQAVAEGDRLYVVQETHAVMASWLLALSCPVFNRPSATWLGGPALVPAVWESYAAVSGLETLERPIDIDTPPPELPPPVRRLVVFGGRVYGPRIPGETAAACRRLARLAGCELLEVVFGRVDGREVFVEATPLADLSVGGKALARDLAASFAGGGP
jgi:hypothetical protein